MLNYSTLSKKPAHFRTFSGLEITEFDTLNIAIKEKYPAFEHKRLQRQDRKRKIGAGHPFILPLTDRLLMLLIYYHMYPSSTLLGYLFCVSQTSVLKSIKKLEPLVSEVLPLPKLEHDKIRKLQTVDEVEAIFPGFRAFLDATEQEIPRPHGKRMRKTHYSGKRKKHTVKTQLTVNKDGLIVHKTAHVSGSMHDYKLYKHSHPHLPSNVRLDLDLGYLGIKDDYPELNCALPFKKKNPGRGKIGVKAEELSSEQKAFNKALASERVIVEHTNSRVKKFRIFGDEFRNRLRRYDVVTGIVCGLINFRISGKLII
ncbi:MAG: transposase [Crenarchaeota archaeon]|nr:transposase [Thermoproteota archaeon]